MTEIQQAMLQSPGLAVENTMKGNFQPTSILHSAEARRREASWEDCFLTGEEAEPEPTVRVGLASPAVPEYRACLQLVLQSWCSCLTLR